MIQAMRDHPRLSLLIPGFIFICTAPILTHPGWVAYWPTALYNDLLISHLPLSQIVHDSLFKWQQAPLWNPYLLSGMPLAADPLAGITYPPNWLAVLWPTGYSVNLIMIGHLVWAGIGAWLLSRSEGAKPTSCAGLCDALRRSRETHHAPQPGTPGTCQRHKLDTVAFAQSS